MRAYLLALVTPLFAVSCSSECITRATFREHVTLERFYRGNTHTHTARSFDSNAPIADVLAWFRESGYNFVVLTDHDRSGVPGEFFALESPTFIVIPGEEITSYGFNDAGAIKPAHVNSICSNGGTVGGITLGTVSDALKDAVSRAIDVSQAIAQINHPNLDYALTAEDILQAHRALLIEVANQYPTASNAGDEAHPSTEKIWDEVLVSGMRIFGVASDDTHDVAPGSYTPPGQGWVQVAAKDLSPDAICDALRVGRFYASTGVEVGQILVRGAEMRLRIEPAPEAHVEEYETFFIGDGGRTLGRVSGVTPSYRLNGGEQYVRATIFGPGDDRAWVQPSLVTEACRP